MGYTLNRASAIKMEGHRKNFKVIPNTGTSLPHNIMTNPKEDYDFAFSCMAC